MPKLYDSKTSQLSYPEILYAAYENNPEDHPKGGFSVWLAHVAALIHSTTDVKIIGNTLFMYKRGEGDSQHIAVIWALNADTMRNLKQHVVDYVEELYAEGCTEFYTQFKSPAITRVLRQAFKDVKDTDDEFTVSKNDKMITVRAVLKESTT